MTPEQIAAWRADVKYMNDRRHSYMDREDARLRVSDAAPDILAHIDTLTAAVEAELAKQRGLPMLMRSSGYESGLEFVLRLAREHR